MVSAESRVCFRNMIAVVLLALLTLGTMLMIFGFSAESREESGGRSERVAILVARMLNPRFDELSPAEQAVAVQRIHHPVRKAAHFLEYALLGFLTAGLFFLLRRMWWTRLTLWQTAWIPAAFGLLYAISDELHQLFSARGARVTDVLIDFCGVLCGVGLMHLCLWICRRIGWLGKEKA